ncbi:hypothetical protein MASR2M70_17770 [Bacillota bacterium]
MSNHVHLLVKEGEKEIGDFVKRLGVSYSYFFNQKYDRVGHLFQGRYISEPVDNDAYFLTVFRYIHQNPQKAGLRPFTRTSYRDYIEREEIADTAFALSLFSSLNELLDYLKAADNKKCLDIEEAGRMTDEKATELICRIGKVHHSQALQNIVGESRNSIIRELKEAGLSIRQIERLSGINRGIISRV